MGRAVARGATLVAVFPANIHMALNPEDYKKIAPAALWGAAAVAGRVHRLGAGGYEAATFYGHDRLA